MRRSRPSLQLVLPAMLFLAGCSGKGSGSSSANSWQEFKSEKYQFSAQFPGDVNVDDAGNFAQFQAAGDSANFRITCAQVPSLTGKEAAMSELRTMRDGAAKDMQATVEESRNADFQGHPGIEFTLAFSINGANMVSHSRYVRCPDRFYQQIVTAPKGTNVEQDVRKFWESFEMKTK